MKKVDSKYQCLPFWSWNDALTPEECVNQINWMHENGVGGFFMHARGGLTTEYLGEQWFKCVEACQKRAQELGMHPYAYDENGWPSGFAGGKLLDDEDNRDRYLTFNFGAYDPKSTVAYDVSGDKAIRTKEGKENVLNVYEHIATSTADICNGEVMDKFIALTHEQYKKHDNGALEGFFTDEPQYYRWNTSFTRVLPQYFKEHYGEDIYDRLGLLFVDKEGCLDFRYKYWKAMQDLMLTNFAKKIYYWCDENGYKLTGHYVEESILSAQMMCCGGIMPFYEYEHIPGIDLLCRGVPGVQMVKQLGSVAAQTGKKQAITECYALCGWDVTPKELKKLGDALYVGGVNLMCQHLMPYSEHGQRKRDYPAHYSKVNPWIRKNFKEFNDYYSVLGSILSNSTELADVALFQPIRSCYFDYKRYRDDWQYGCEKLNASTFNTAEKLSALQISFHFLDETILAEHGSVEGDELICGNCRYKYLVFPLTYTMDKSTESLLRQYVANGGKVLFLEGKPTYLEGQPHSYDYVSTNTSLEEIVAHQIVQGAENPDVRMALRQDEEGRTFVFVTNVSDHPTDIEYKMKDYSSFECYDVMKDSWSVISPKLHLDVSESHLLYFSNKPLDYVSPTKAVNLGPSFEVVEPVDNYLTLDMPRFSVDGGKTYSEKLAHMGIFDELLKRRYKGELLLKYEFEVKDVPSECHLLAEDTHTKEILVNGNAVKKLGSSKYDYALYEYDMASAIVVGHNEIVVKMDYYQGENVYYALFGENVTESLKNCLAYDTDIEPVYLKGEFGVEGKFEPGKLPNVLVGDDFIVVKQGKKVTNFIQDGFPFFSGDIKLRQNIKIDDVHSSLILPDRYQLMDITLNGKKLGLAMFESKVDLSSSAKVGDNDLVITYTVSNRNLMGPSHTPAQEDLAVGPGSFELNGQWKEGKSKAYRDSYSFVKPIH